ncbi:autophagy-related protein 16-1-like isoform X2 [Antedon mediterranea]|uniref:autophagy-related protein 16-1-like isoform X2 n=1 Tax=Antedon mediterranea TaxID=105859 RepID=UPI003AF5C250
MDKPNIGWKEHILQQLRDRNGQKNIFYKDIIQLHNKLTLSIDTVKAENVQLQIEVAKLKDANLKLQVQVESGGGKGGGEKNTAMEQKMYKLQEELTDLHRTKGENAQQIIDISKKLQLKEKAVNSANEKIFELESSLAAFKSEMKNMESTVVQKEKENEILRDEQQALHLAYSGLEVKLRDVQQDNDDLLKRWLEKKALDANIINNSNDEFYMNQGKKIAENLEEASGPVITIPEGGTIGSPKSPLHFTVQMSSIPTRVLRKFDTHEGDVNAIRCSPSGKKFATGGADRKVNLWDFSIRDASSTSPKLASLTGSNAGITSVDFDVQENFVLGASRDFAVRLWGVQDHRLKHALTGHGGNVLAAKFLGDANKVVSGSHDRTLKIWDLNARACSKTMFAGSMCNDLVTSDGAGSNIISGHFDKRVRFWDTRSHDPNANEILLQGKVTSLDLSNDRTQLLVCSRDDTLKVIDLRMNQVMQTLCADGFHVSFDWTRAVFSPDSEYAVCGSGDGSIFLWNAKTNKLEKTLKEHNSAVVSVAWHPGGQYMFSCDTRKKVIIWTEI